MNGETLVRLRGILMGGAGFVCLCYAVLALIMARPDPVYPFIPGIAGVVASIAIFAAFWQASSGSRKQASDETFKMEMNQAAKIGFWVAVAMYPGFAPFLAWELTTFEVIYAVMGTLTAAAFLLSFAFISLRRL